MTLGDAAKSLRCMSFPSLGLSSSCTAQTRPKKPEH
jgi:hypothetical protein